MCLTLSRVSYLTSISAIFPVPRQHAAQFRKNREGKLRPLSEQEPNQINKIGCEEGLESREQSLVSSLVHFMEHQFTGDGCFWTKLGCCPALKGSNVLFYNLIKKHGRQLGVEQRTEFKGNLETQEMETSRPRWIAPGQIRDTALCALFSSSPPDIT